jgi:hypothetical protein
MFLSINGPEISLFITLIDTVEAKSSGFLIWSPDRHQAKLITRTAVTELPTREIRIKPETKSVILASFSKCGKLVFVPRMTCLPCREHPRHTLEVQRPVMTLGMFLLLLLRLVTLLILPLPNCRLSENPEILQLR